MPKNILSIPIKTSPSQPSLSGPLAHAIRTYISENYTDTHPDAFGRDVRELCRLREECAKLEVHVTSVDGAIRYHAQLVFLSTKFPPNVSGLWE